MRLTQRRPKRPTPVKVKRANPHPKHDDNHKTPGARGEGSHEQSAHTSSLHLPNETHADSHNTTLASPRKQGYTYVPPHEYTYNEKTQPRILWRPPRSLEYTLNQYSPSVYETHQGLQHTQRTKKNPFQPPHTHNTPKQPQTPGHSLRAAHTRK
jgi:hypothetical protein